MVDNIRRFLIGRETTEGTRILNSYPTQYIHIPGPLKIATTLRFRISKDTEIESTVTGTPLQVCDALETLGKAFSVDLWFIEEEIARLREKYGLKGTDTEA